MPSPFDEFLDLTPFEKLSKLRNPAFFMDLFPAWLKEFNKTNGCHFAMGPDVDFVYKQWSRMLETQEALLEEDVFLIFFQDALGELCHGLARYDTVIQTGAAKSPSMDFTTQEVLNFIEQHKCAFFALDFCSYLYREVMPFRADMYTTTSADVVRTCEVIDHDPVRGQEFVRLLGYPDKSKLLH